MKDTSARLHLNTPKRELSKSWVKVIHPPHYLFGQRVEIIRTLAKADFDDVVILLPNKTYAVISLKLTDYYSPEGEALTATSHLLDIIALSDVVKLIDNIQRRESIPSNKDMPEETSHNPP
jgi:Family of unknown function (DUF5372)